MKNRYLLTLMTLLAANLSVPTKMVAAESNNVQQGQLRALYQLDQNWRNTALEKEIEDIRDTKYQTSAMSPEALKKNRLDIDNLETQLTQKIDQYHQLVLAKAKRQPQQYEQFIREQKQQLFERNKQAWASLKGGYMARWAGTWGLSDLWERARWVGAYSKTKNICLRLSPNSHGCEGYNSTQNDDSLFAGWKPFPSYQKDIRESNNRVFPSPIAVSAQESAQELNSIWDKVYVEPKWNNMTFNQKIGKVTSPLCDSLDNPKTLFPVTLGALAVFAWCLPKNAK